MFKALILHEDRVVETDRIDDVVRARDAKQMVWVQLFERDAEAERMLLEVFHIHPLAVEDIWNDLQIPKVEDFDEYLQIIVHRIHDNCGLGEVRFDEVDLVVGHTWLVTRAHHLDVTALSETVRRKLPKLMARGPAFVAHAVLDRIVDQNLPYVDHYENAIETIEADLVRASRSKHPDQFGQRIFLLTRALQRFRRFALQQQDVLGRLARAEFDEIPRDARPFYTDVYDHFSRVTQLADSSREVLAGLLDVYWSMQSSHMNDVMKTLTLMSTIMLPLTFIAGLYGMNFEHMPELHWLYGYPAALFLMVGVAVAILVYFRARRWL